jgi:hypothetical protein
MVPLKYHQNCLYRKYLFDFPTEIKDILDSSKMISLFYVNQCYLCN